MVLNMKNTNSKGVVGQKEDPWPEVNKNHSTTTVTNVNPQQHALQGFFALLRSAATNLGEEFNKFGAAAQRGFADNTSSQPTKHHHQGKLLPPAPPTPEDDPDEVIVFQDKVLIEPEILIFPTQQQDVNLFPTLQLLEPQTVKVLEPLEAVIAVFRDQLGEVQQKTNDKMTRNQHPVVVPQTPLRRRISGMSRLPLKRLMSTEEIKRRKAIERKLSLIRKGRLVLPPSSSSNVGITA